MSAPALIVAFLAGAFGVGGAVVVVLAAHPEKVQVWASLVWGLLRRATKRSQLASTQSRAIDLQLCRKLAERLSLSAVTVYRLNILDPSILDDPTIAALLDQLQTIDLGGLFVPVLLQELIKLGATYPADSLP